MERDIRHDQVNAAGLLESSRFSSWQTLLPIKLYNRPMRRKECFAIGLDMTSVQILIRDVRQVQVDNSKSTTVLDRLEL
jgi:hypothetical protein